MKYLTILLLFFVTASSAEVVKVGVYHFPPFVFAQGEEPATGLSLSLLDAMNLFQKNYHFEPVLTTPNRRYGDFDKHRFDMLIFESKAWGWQHHPVASSQTFLTGAEVYVALNKDKRGQDYFNDFKHKALVGILGYHYGFAQFNADANHLKQHFNIQLTDSHEKNIRLILNRRGDIAAVPRAYLLYYFSQYPQNRDKLMVSQIKDQVYRHTVLLREDRVGINIKDINELLLRLKAKGVLDKLWRNYGIEAD